LTPAEAMEDFRRWIEETSGGGGGRAVDDRSQCINQSINIPTFFLDMTNRRIGLILKGLETEYKMMRAN
jgi:hypothetical protein